MEVSQGSELEIMITLILSSWGNAGGGCAPRTPCIPGAPDPPNGASRRFGLALENLERREVLDPGVNVPDRADLPLAIQMDSCVHGLLDSGTPDPRTFFLRSSEEIFCLALQLYFVFLKNMLFSCYRLDEMKILS